MRRLPSTMSLYEVERRVARIRWWLLLALAGLYVLACASLLIWAATFDIHWLAATGALMTFAAGPAVGYLVIRTPAMVPRMAEHYRTRGVRVGEDQ